MFSSSSTLWDVSEFPFFERPNNSPMYVYATFCLLNHVSRDTWFAFRFLDIVSNAALKIGGQIFKSLVSILWAIYPEVEFMGHLQIFFLKFFEEQTPLNFN
jgi:hypothetical protein